MFRMFSLSNGGILGLSKQRWENKHSYTHTHAHYIQAACEHCWRISLVVINDVWRMSVLSCGWNSTQFNLLLFCIQFSIHFKCFLYDSRMFFYPSKSDQSQNCFVKIQINLFVDFLSFNVKRINVMSMETACLRYWTNPLRFWHIHIRVK